MRWLVRIMTAALAIVVLAHGVTLQSGAPSAIIPTQDRHGSLVIYKTDEAAPDVLLPRVRPLTARDTPAAAKTCIIGHCQDV